MNYSPWGFMDTSQREFCQAAEDVSAVVQSRGLGVFVVPWVAPSGTCAGESEVPGPDQWQQVNLGGFSSIEGLGSVGI